MHIKRIKEFINEVLIHYLKPAKILDIYDHGNTIFMYDKY